MCLSQSSRDSWLRSSWNIEEVIIAEALFLGDAFDVVAIEPRPVDKLQLFVARLAVFLVIVGCLLAAEARVRVADRDVVAERDLDAAERVEEEFFVRNALEDAVESDRAD